MADHDKLVKNCEKFYDLTTGSLEKVAGKFPFWLKKKDKKDGKDDKDGACVFPANSPKVKDKKEHFPLGTEAQAKSALSQVNKLKKVPDWFKGTLPELVKAVTSKVKSKFPKLDDKTSK